MYAYKCINKFWSVENIEAKDNYAIHDFKKYISHDGQRYVTKLPFRLDHELLPNDFLLCEQRLKELKIF